MPWTEPKTSNTFRAYATSVAVDDEVQGFFSSARRRTAFAPGDRSVGDLVSHVLRCIGCLVRSVGDLVSGVGDLVGNRVDGVGTLAAVPTDGGLAAGRKLPVSAEISLARSAAYCSTLADRSWTTRARSARSRWRSAGSSAASFCMSAGSSERRRCTSVGSVERRFCMSVGSSASRSRSWEVNVSARCANAGARAGRSRSAVTAASAAPATA